MKVDILYVLILILDQAGGGTAALSAEYTSKEKCEAAGESAKLLCTNNEGWGSRVCYRARYSCSPK